MQTRTVCAGHRTLFEWRQEHVQRWQNFDSQWSISSILRCVAASRGQRTPLSTSDSTSRASHSKSDIANSKPDIPSSPTALSWLNLGCHSPGMRGLDQATSQQAVNPPVSRPTAGSRSQGYKYIYFLFRLVPSGTGPWPPNTDGRNWRCSAVAPLRHSVVWLKRNAAAGKISGKPGLSAELGNHERCTPSAGVARGGTRPSPGGGPPMLPSPMHFF